MDKFDKELQDEKTEENQDPIIQEQIKPWHKRKFKKILSVIGLSLLAGILFGVAARFVFKYSDGIISKLFGLNQPYDNINSKNPVTISTPTAGAEQENENGIKIEQNKSEEKQGTSPSQEQTVPADTDAYLQAVEKMRSRAFEAQKSIVNISGVTNIVNWMGEKIEQKESSLGIIVTESENDLYILSYYDRVQNADRIELTLKSGNEYLVSLIAHDEGYNLAVLYLSKQALKKEDSESISVLKIGNSDEIYAGMPIIGIGSLDGSIQMTEYGYITSDSHVEYITDAALGIFTTNLSFDGNSEGIVTDIEGKLVGILDRKLGSSIKINVNKCLKINSLLAVAEKLCNGGGRVYFGINAEDIPSWALKENDIESGIYVNSVEPSSPAADAGIRRGDFIISVDGHEINNVETFSDILLKAAENTPLTIDVYRSIKSSDQRFTVTVTPVKHG